MTLIYCTGFDRGDDFSLYDITGAGFITDGGRTGNAYYAGPLIGGGGGGEIDLKNDYQELIVGTAVKFFDDYNYDVPFLQLRNINHSTNVAVFRKTNKLFGISLRDAVEYFDTNITLSSNIWYYIEIKTKIHDTNGYVIVKINGLEVFNQTELNTAYDSSILSSRFICLYNYQTPEIPFDDVYVCDTSGEKNNDFLGDISVRTLLPTRDGTYNDFSPVDASNRYEAVNEISPNWDINYVTGSDSGMKQTFGFTAPSIEGRILGIVHNVVMRKDGTSEFVRLLAKYGTTETSGNLISLLDSYVNYQTIYQTKLDSDEDWSINDLDSLELGIMIE